MNINLPNSLSAVVFVMSWSNKQIMNNICANCTTPRIHLFVKFVATPPILIHNIAFTTRSSILALILNVKFVANGTFMSSAVQYAYQ